MGVIGYKLDIERLLWIPGQKTIFLPSIETRFSMANIMSIELDKILPLIPNLFERDMRFYARISEINDVV